MPRAEAIGRFCWEVFRSNMCEGDCALRRTMKEGRSFVSSSTYIINSSKKRIPISVSTALLRNEEGKTLGGVETFRDNTVVEELRRELSGSFRQGDMISRSRLMKKIFSVLPQIAWNRCRGAPGGVGKNRRSHAAGGALAARGWKVMIISVASGKGGTGRPPLPSIWRWPWGVGWSCSTAMSKSPMLTCFCSQRSREPSGWIRPSPWWMNPNAPSTKNALPFAASTPWPWPVTGVDRCRSEEKGRGADASQRGWFSCLERLAAQVIYYPSLTARQRAPFAGADLRISISPSVTRLRG